MPHRIQRTRLPGWRMPKGAIYVGRGSLWGNPFKIVVGVDGTIRVVDTLCEGVIAENAMTESEAAAVASNHYRFLMTVAPERLAPEHSEFAIRQRALDTLRGRDLACWCKLDRPCHADVLLELANTEPA